MEALLGNTSALTVDITAVNYNATYFWQAVPVNTGGQATGCTIFSFTTQTAPVAPVNDLCANAIPLTAGFDFNQNPLTGSVIGATTATGLTFACQPNRANEVWYSVVVPPSGSVTIETQLDGTSTLTDTVLSVFSGDCTNLVEVGCDDDNGIGNFSIIPLTGQTPGTTLYVGVWRYSFNNYNTFKVSAYDASLANANFNTTNFTAYPNPVKDILNLSFAKIITKVQVNNILGQEVLSKTINSNETQLDLSSLSKGTYLVKVTSDDLVKTLKIIKE